jgi:hypothetical protein
MVDGPNREFRSYERVRDPDTGRFFDGMQPASWRLATGEVNVSESHKNLTWATPGASNSVW